MLVWYMHVIRNVPSRRDVSPGSDSYRLLMLRAMGKTMLADRAVIDGTPVARVRSVRCSA